MSLGLAFSWQSVPMSPASAGSVLVPIVVPTSTTKPDTSPLVTIGTTKIKVDLATTTATFKKGLSGRPSLASDTGLLFIFKTADIYQFWMPDMHFPIDIIWINNGKVVDVDENATNIFDPKHPVFYRPSSAARYVLEVNAGFFKKHGLKIGDKVQLQNIQPRL